MTLPGTASGPGSSAAGPPTAALVLALLALLGFVFVAALYLLGRSHRRRLAREADAEAAARPVDRRDPWKEAGKRIKAS